MTLGIALVVIFILYLIDKHNRWRQTIKVVCWSLGIFVAAYGGILLWDNHSWKARHPEPTVDTSELPAPEPMRPATTAVIMNQAPPFPSGCDPKHSEADSTIYEKSYQDVKKACVVAKFPLKHAYQTILPMYENTCFRSKTARQEWDLIAQIDTLPEDDFKKTMDDFTAINAGDRLLGKKGCVN